MVYKTLVQRKENKKSQTLSPIEKDVENIPGIWIPRLARFNQSNEAIAADPRVQRG